MPENSVVVLNEVLEIEQSDKNVLERLINQNDISGIELAVKACSNLIDYPDEVTMETSLHHASRIGNVEIVNCLIKLGFSKVSRDINNFTPLMTASKEGHMTCVKALTLTSKHTDLYDKNGWTSVVWASYKGHTEIVEYLISIGANVDITVSFNMNCLLWACSRGFLEIAIALCKKGVDIDHTDEFGNTALIWASKKGFIQIVKLLLKYKANQNLIGTNGSTALITAIKNNFNNCAVAILNHENTNVNQSSRDGHTAISYACRHGSVSLVKKLIEKGAFVNKCDDEGESPLMKAVKYGHCETVDEMLKGYAEVDAKNRNGKTALHLAVESNNFVNVRSLLDYNANMEAVDLLQQTALFLAVKIQTYKISKLLVNYGANITSTDLHGDLPLHIAMRSKNLQLVELMLHEPKNACTLYYVNSRGESSYEIDQQNETNILSQLFGTSARSMSYKNRFDLYTHSLAEMFTEPSFQTPICTTLYAKCRSGLSFVLDNLKNQILLYKSTTIRTKPLKWTTCFFIFYISLLIGLLSAIFSTNPKLVVSLLTFLLAAALYGFIVFINSERAQGKWCLVKKFSDILIQKQSYFLLLLKILFTKSYCDETQSRNMRFILVGPLQILSVETQSLEFHLTSSVVRMVENEIGVLAFRFARAMNKEELSQTPYEGWRFRRLCCVPSIIWVSVLILAFTSILIILVSDQTYLHDDSQMLPLIYLLTGICVFIFLISSPFLWKLIKSCFHSPSLQHKRGIKATFGGKIHSKYHQQHRGENPFMKEMCAAVKAVDRTQGFQSRIILLIDALETTNGEKVLQCVESIHSCFNRQLLVTVLCTDYHLLSSAVSSSFLRPATSLYLDANEYLQNTIQLPIFLAEHHRPPRNKDVIEADYNVKQMKLNQKFQRMKQFEALRRTSLNSETFNPKLIKRIMSLLMISARIMRANDVDFSWDSLFTWIILTELWPFTCLSLIQYHKIKSSDLDLNLNQLDSLSKVPDEIFNSDLNPSSSSAFIEFISNSKFQITINEMIKYQKFSVNIDPQTSKNLPNFQDISHPASVTSMSSSSTRTELSDWTVDDVCVKIRSLSGLDGRNLSKYEKFIRSNNFNGIAVFTCDLNDLKMELKTSFGDWSIIRRFIIEQRDKIFRKTRNEFANMNSPVEDPSFEFYEMNSKVDQIYKKTQNLVSCIPSSPVQIENNDNVESGIEQLNSNERLAYDDAFKEYLRLQVIASETNKETTSLDLEFDETNYETSKLLGSDH